MELFEPEILPDPKPIEAMVKCEDALSTLPENFVNLPVADAVEILSVNKAVDATFYFQCKTKQEDLTRWVKSQQ